MTPHEQNVVECALRDLASIAGSFEQLGYIEQSDAVCELIKDVAETLPKQECEKALRAINAT